MSGEFGTWHHGLIARWWSEFNVATPEELAYFGAAIRKFGEPALDLGCGTGRIMFPLIAEGFDVDGADISADMIALAGAEARKSGVSPNLTVQPMHELDLGRKYRTIYICGSFGLGGRRDLLVSGFVWVVPVAGEVVRLVVCVAWPFERGAKIDVARAARRCG